MFFGVPVPEGLAFPSSDGETGPLVQDRLLPVQQPLENMRLLASLQRQQVDRHARSPPLQI